MVGARRVLGRERQNSVGVWSYSRSGTWAADDHDKRSERPFKILREETGFPQDPSKWPVNQPYTCVGAQNKLFYKSTDRAAAAGSKLRLFCGTGGWEEKGRGGRREEHPEPRGNHQSTLLHPNLVFSVGALISSHLISSSSHIICHCSVRLDGPYTSMQNRLGTAN